MFSRVGSNPVGGSFLFYFYGEKIRVGAAKIWPQGESAFCEGLKISHYFLRSHLRYQYFISFLFVVVLEGAFGPSAGMVRFCIHPWQQRPAQPEHPD